MQLIGIFILISIVIAIIKFLVTSVTEFFNNLYNFFFVDFWPITLAIVALLIFVHLRNKKEAKETAQHDNEIRRREEERLEKLRDSDTQSEPYEYEIGKHANNTLALRYGIANTTTKTTPYYFYAKGGVKTRDPAKDRKKTIDANTIKLKKLKALPQQNHFLVELTDFKKRKAIAIHVKGEEFIRTFYPLDPATNDEDKGWWDRNPELELALKDNRTFNLKELAKFHIEKTVPVTSRR